MSSDLKMEIFACFRLHKVWFDKGWKYPEKNVFDIYEEECLKDNCYSEVCNLIFELAVLARYFAFPKIYYEEIENAKPINWRSLSDFYDHVTRVCDKNDLFGYLTIFEKMFATFAYVLFVCERICTHSYVDVVNYGHIIWAMYFDKFTGKFYDEGGWNELKKIALSYDCLQTFLYVLKFETETTSHLQVWKQASVNYIQFKKAIKYYISKYKHKSRIHLCKLWVKFHIEHFEEYIRIPSSYEDSVDNMEVEMLFQQGRLIFKSALYDYEIFDKMQEKYQEIFGSKEILISKIFAGEEIKTSEFLFLEYLRTCDTVCNEFPDSRKCSEIQLQSECSSSTRKLVASQIIDETENVKNNSSEIEMLANKMDLNLDRYSSNRCNNLSGGTRSTQLDSDIEKSTKSSDLNHKTATKCSDDENETYLDETSTRNEKRQRQLLMAGKSSSLNHTEETRKHKNITPENVPIPIDFYSRREAGNSYNEGESSRSPLKSSLFSKNEGYCRDTDITCDLSTNLMSVSQCERNGIPKQICTRKDVPDANNVTMNSGERKKTITELNKLREEQADPEIRNFLRMIVVLGDRQGIQYVRGTSCSGEERPEDLEVSPKKKKKKKRSAKKPGK